MSEPCLHIPTQFNITYPNPKSSDSPLFISRTQPTQNPNNVQSQQFQQFQTATISANNAKFPYLEKEKYEIWAMKMEYWIQNADHNLWRIVQQGNSPKRLGKDAKGNTIVHPPVSLDEHVAVQRENKVGLVGMTNHRDEEDHAQQQFTDFSARPDNDDINLKFLRALPASWSLELDVRIGHSYGVKTAAAPTHSAFIRAASSGSKLNYSNQQSIVPSVSQTSRVDQLRWKNWDLKLLMAMLSVGLTDLRRSRPKMNYNISYCPDLTERKVTEVKTDEQSLVSVDSCKLVSITAKNKTGEVEKVYGMMAGLHADNSGADVSKAAAEVAMMGISPKAQKEKKEWEVKFEATLARFEKWKESSKNLEKTVEEVKTSFHHGLSKAGRCMQFLHPSLELLPTHTVDIVEKTVGPSLLTHESLQSCDSSLKTRQRPKTSTCKSLVCGSKLHLINDWTFIIVLCLFPCNQSRLCSAGSRNSPASDNAGGSNPAASRNRPAVNSAGRPNPAGWSKRPAPGDPSTDNDIGIVDSGCSRSMTGNKEKLDDFVQVKGGIVKFGGGDGRISGKGTIRTSKLDFENVYYVEELQHFNLFSVSQICDKKNKVLFTDTDCLVLTEEFQLPDESQVVLRIPRERDLYTFSISELQPEQNVTCLVAKASLDESTRWHRRMAHVNFKTINKLAKEGLVDGLPLKVFTNEHNCVACNKGKQHKASYKHISAVRLITETLQLLHMDLFGPTNIRSIDQKYYSLVVTDDFGRFTWTFFLGTKDETFYVLKEFIALIENQLNKKVKGIRCDNGTEFKNAKLIELCGEKGIKRDYSNPRTPQQNGVAERKNRTLIEAAKTMVSITNPHNETPYELISGKVPQIGHLKPFGCQVTILNTNDHLGNFEGKADEGYVVGNCSEVDEQVIVVPSFPSNSFAGPSSSNGPSVMERNADYAEELAKLQRQEYEAKDAAKDTWKTADTVTAVSASVPATSIPAGSINQAAGGSVVPSTPSSSVVAPVHADTPLPSGHSLGSSENSTRFSSPSDLANHISSSSEMEGIHHHPTTGIFSESTYDADFGGSVTNLAPTIVVDPVPTRRVHTVHPISQILGDITSPVLTRGTLKKFKFRESALVGYIHDQQRNNHTDYLHCLFSCFLSQLEPSSVAQALNDPDWVEAMQEEMQQFVHQDVWKLVPLPEGKTAIRTKWILKNKRDARGILVRNKARLVAQGHMQEEGIDYDKVFAPMARIEAIRLFLAF
ncbi:putative ribonuclease H-like domain-containing protein, partial [Tanacetum coccineum]